MYLLFSFSTTAAAWANEKVEYVPLQIRYNSCLNTPGTPMTVYNILLELILRGNSV